MSEPERRTFYIVEYKFRNSWTTFHHPTTLKDARRVVEQHRSQDDEFRVVQVDEVRTVID